MTALLIERSSGPELDRDVGARSRTRPTGRTVLAPPPPGRAPPAGGRARGQGPTRRAGGHRGVSFAGVLVHREERRSAPIEVAGEGDQEHAGGDRGRSVSSYCSAITNRMIAVSQAREMNEMPGQPDGRGRRRVDRELAREELEGPVGRPERHAEDPPVQRAAGQEHHGKAEDRHDEAGGGRDERQRPRVRRRRSRDGRDRSLLRHRDSLLGDAGPSGSDPSHAGPGRAQSGSGEARESIPRRRLRRRRKPGAGTFVLRPRHPGRGRALAGLARAEARQRQKR